MEISERRIAHRYAVDLPAYVELNGGKRCPFKVCDVSVSGMGITVANHWLVNHFPPMEIPRKIHLVNFDLNIILPKPFLKVVVKLGVVYIRRLNMEYSLLGCRLEEFKALGALHLSEYLISSQANFNHQDKALFAERL